jgi:LDH2 family malate/lactate/ureidoglycolate dehydrogenase
MTDRHDAAMLRRLAAHVLCAYQAPAEHAKTTAERLVDGDNGLGQATMTQAADLAIAKAASS